MLKCASFFSYVCFVVVVVLHSPRSFVCCWFLCEFLGEPHCWRFTITIWSTEYRLNSSQIRRYHHRVHVLSFYLSTSTFHYFILFVFISRIHNFSLSFSTGNDNARHICCFIEFRFICVFEYNFWREKMWHTSVLKIILYVIDIIARLKSSPSTIPFITIDRLIPTCIFFFSYLQKQFPYAVVH